MTDTTPLVLLSPTLNRLEDMEQLETFETITSSSKAERNKAVKRKLTQDCDKSWTSEQLVVLENFKHLPELDENDESMNEISHSSEKLENLLEDYLPGPSKVQKADEDNDVDAISSSFWQEIDQTNGKSGLQHDNKSLLPYCIRTPSDKILGDPSQTLVHVSHATPNNHISTLCSKEGITDVDVDCGTNTILQGDFSIMRQSYTNLPAVSESRVAEINNCHFSVQGNRFDKNLFPLAERLFYSNTTLDQGNNSTNGIAHSLCRPIIMPADHDGNALGPSAVRDPAHDCLSTNANMSRIPELNCFSSERTKSSFIEESALHTRIPESQVRYTPTVSLSNKELWWKFYKIGTEMIITKAGRRMFPSIKIDVHGLNPDKRYIMAVDIVPVDNSRYRYVYHSSQWMAAGQTDAEPTPCTYIHPDSPSKGEIWMRQSVTFDKLKLTNYEMNKKGHIVLHSMHKYQPRIHILECDVNNVHDNSYVVPHNRRIDEISQNGLKTFVFSECAFTTVTAYQNQQITKLKIDRNPFAKGFREASKQWQGKPEQHTSVGKSTVRIVSVTAQGEDIQHATSLQANTSNRTAIELPEPQHISTEIPEVSAQRNQRRSRL
ncbi:unnamed protein product [Clavelina lepadiformis]|uniref:T-box domain-containing protein n=1 Tax=Clavelina lepadiformis TaxID=159417 RepID=A0ABP0F685_CLALP